MTMKKYFLTLLTYLLFSIYAFSQSAIEIKKGAIEPVVNEVDLSSVEIYDKTTEWINYTYKNADAVIGSSVDTKFIRMRGMKIGYARWMSAPYDLEYVIRLDFKDGRYRLQVEDLINWANGYSSPVIISDYYKKNGSLRPSTANFIEGIKTALNDLNTSLYNHITGASKQSDNW